MSTSYLVRLTGPQIRELRAAADSHEQYLIDNVDSDNADAARALPVLQRAHSALIQAELGQPDDNGDDPEEG